MDRKRAEDLLSAFKFNKRRNEEKQYIAIRVHYVLQLTENRKHNELNTHRRKRKNVARVGMRWRKMCGKFQYQNISVMT